MNDPRADAITFEQDGEVYSLFAQNDEDDEELSGFYVTEEFLRRLGYTKGQIVHDDLEVSEGQTSLLDDVG